MLELETQVELARRLALLAEDDADTLLQRTAELGRIPNGLRRSLRAALERRPDHIRESNAEYERRIDWALCPEN